MVGYCCERPDHAFSPFGRGQNSRNLGIECLEQSELFYWNLEYKYVESNVDDGGLVSEVSERCLKLLSGSFVIFELRFYGSGYLERKNHLRLTR